MNLYTHLSCISGCFGIWSVVMLSSLSFSTTPDDHVLFFEGDAPGDGVNNVSESLTGACVILFPHWVCIVMTSYKSGLDPESLNFGTE